MTRVMKLLIWRGARTFSLASVASGATWCLSTGKISMYNFKQRIKMLNRGTRRT